MIQSSKKLHRVLRNWTALLDRVPTYGYGRTCAIRSNNSLQRGFRSASPVSLTSRRAMVACLLPPLFALQIQKWSFVWKTCVDSLYFVFKCVFVTVFMWVWIIYFLTKSGKFELYFSKSFLNEGDLIEDDWKVFVLVNVF